MSIQTGGGISEGRMGLPQAGGRTGVVAVSPTTVVQGRTDHRLTSPAFTYGSISAKARTA
jgi:hypothetical protein